MKHLKKFHLKTDLLKWLPPKSVLYLTLFWVSQAALAIGYIIYKYDEHFLRLVMHVSIVSLLSIILTLPFTLRSTHCIPLILRRVALALILSIVNGLLLCFYAMTILGYKSWSGPFTFELLHAYTGHLDVLLNIYGLSLTGTVIFLSCMWLLIFCGYYFFSKSLLKEPEAGNIEGMRRHSGWPVPVLSFVLIFIIVYSNSYKSWQMVEPFHIAWLNGHGCLRQAPQGIFSKPRLSDKKQLSMSDGQRRKISARPLVLITVDALRSDQMGVYGAPRDNTPFLSDLFRKKQLHRIDSAYSICTTSFCGMLGVLSSRYWHQLNEPPENIADLLKQYGYRISFMLSGDHLNFFGIRRVFGPHIDLFRDGSMENKKYANDDRSVLSWMKQCDWQSADHTFLYVHLMSAHIIGLRDPHFQKWRPDKEWDVPKLFYSRRAYQNNYHNGILQADNTIRQIFEILDRQGLLKRALVVITADHGEFLGESGNFGHGYKPYEEMVRIPLLIYDGLASRYPAGSMASQVDIAPTMLHAIGAPIPQDWSGIPLQCSTSRNAVYVASYDVSGVVADREGQRFKYLRYRKDNREMLFNLYGAKMESVNLAGQMTAIKTLTAMRALEELAQ